MYGDARFSDCHPVILESSWSTSHSTDKAVAERDWRASELSDNTPGDRRHLLLCLSATMRVEAKYLRHAVHVTQQFC